MTTKVFQPGDITAANEAQFLSNYGELLSVGDVSKITGLCTRSVRHYLQNGYLPGVKVGARWIISKQKLIDFFGM